MKTRSVRQTAVAALVVMAGLIASISPAAAFSDVKPSHPFHTEITWASNNGIVNGYPDGTFRGGGQVTREAVSAFMFRLASNPAYNPSGQSFSDVPLTHPFYEEIEWMVDDGIASGFNDGSFRPGAIVTRHAIASFIYRLLGSPLPPPNLPWVFNDVSPGHRFFVPIMFIWNFYIADGYSTPFGDVFRPSNAVTRQAATAFLYRTDQLLEGTSAGAGGASGSGGGAGAENRGLAWDVDMPAEVAAALAS